MSQRHKNLPPSRGHLIESAEAYNHSMFSNQLFKDSTADVTEQILFCQNAVNNLDILSTDTPSTCVSEN